MDRTLLIGARDAIRANNLDDAVEHLRKAYSQAVTDDFRAYLDAAHAEWDGPKPSADPDQFTLPCARAFAEDWLRDATEALRDADEHSSRELLSEMVDLFAKAFGMEG